MHAECIDVFMRCISSLAITIHISLYGIVVDETHVSLLLGMVVTLIDNMGGGGVSN